MEQPEGYKHIKWEINGKLFVEISDKAVPGIRPGYFINEDGLIYNSVNHRYKTGYIESDGRYCGVEFIKRDGSRVHIAMHKLLMRVFRYFPECDNYEVNHIDGHGDGKHNNSLDNLEWCTHNENMKEAIRTGLIVRGEDSPAASISNETARKICKELEGDRYVGKFEDIARKYNTTPMVVLNIAYGYGWREISKDYNIDYSNKLNNRFTKEQVYEICKIFEQFKVNDSNYRECYEYILQTLNIQRTSSIRQRIKRLYYRDPGYFKYITDLYNW